MSFHRHIETLFVLAVGLACASLYSADRQARTTRHSAGGIGASNIPSVTVVVVSAKRMTLEQKRRALEQEQAAGPARKIG